MVKVLIANATHHVFAAEICKEMEISALQRGTGIARRDPSYIIKKMDEGKAVIAIDEYGFAGFCYIETWDHEKFVANSGLIVKPDYRKSGLGLQIKQKIFELSKSKYPGAKIFGITTSLAVMKINSSLGYHPVTFSELTTDEAFWTGCKSCKNYDILQRNDRKMCLCTGMLYDPDNKNRFDFKKKLKVLERLRSIKLASFLKIKSEKKKEKETEKEMTTL